VKVTFSANSKQIKLAKDSMAVFFNLLGLFADPSTNHNWLPEMDITP
jgi:hypothetical protein